MCYICNCFSWTLDLIQRGITFCLTCCMTCVICFGLTITIIAGIAFGYHYSFAEFITYTPSDVTVYMRRGQFYEEPIDIAPPLVRRMGDEDDLFSENITSEYEEEVVPKKESESLSEKWLKDDDAREYAIRLTKYKNKERKEEKEREDKHQRTKSKYMPTLLPTRQLSRFSIVIPTTIIRSDSSQIVLRKFLPLNDMIGHTKEAAGDLYHDNNEKYITRPSEIVFNERQMEKLQPDVIQYDDVSERKQISMSDIEQKSPADLDDFIEEESENNIMYRPV